MAEETERLVRRELRSPRSAAIAGIVFSILMMTTMILLSSIVIPDEFSREWLETRSNTVRLALGLVPFSGIAFLWFTGVIRDRLGDQEDRFFATVFLGSGILYVGMGFVWAATLGAIFGSYALTTYNLVDIDVFVFGSAFINEIVGNYTLRMAGVYMTAICTLWTRTGVMPRWLIIISYILALGFLIGAERIREARFIFPGWVLVVSVYILVLNYRRTHDQESEAI